MVRTVYDISIPKIKHINGKKQVIAYNKGVVAMLWRA